MQSFSIDKPRLLTEVLRYEVDPNFTREQEFLPAQDSAEPEIALAIGEVLGKVTEGGAIVPLAPGASDGSQVAYGVALYSARSIEESTSPVLVLARGPAVVVLQKLVWPAGISAGQKATALAQLEAKGIIARND